MDTDEETAGMTSEYRIQLLGGFLIEKGDTGRTRPAGQLLDWARHQSKAAGTRAHACSKRNDILRGQSRGAAHFLLRAT